MKAIRKFAADFLFYLRRGLSVRAAWAMAKVTL